MAHRSLALRRVWPLALLVPLGVSLPGQDASDPLAAAAAMAAEAPLQEGHAITLVDGGTGAPLVGATVIAFVFDSRTPEILDAARVIRRDYTADPSLGSLAEAARFGRKWVTDAFGRTVIPSDYRGVLFLVAGDVFDQESVAPARETTIAVYPRTWIAVQIARSDGTPAPGVWVRLQTGNSEVTTPAGVSTRQPTDASGRARVELGQSYLRSWRGQPMRLMAEVCGAERAASREIDPLRWRGASPGPLALRLPPVGRLRVSALDGKGDVRAPRIVRVTTVDTRQQAEVGVILREGEPMECPVALDAEYLVCAWFPHQIGGQELIVAGPKRADELVPVVLDARRAPCLVTTRVFRADGEPLAGGFLIRQGRSFVTGTTDAFGRIWIAMDPNRDSDMKRLSICSPDGYTGRSNGAVSIPLPALTPGVHDLGNVTLGREPLLVAGRVVDDRGRPVQGASVWRRFANHISEVPLAAKTDKDGRFALRMLDPPPFPVELLVTHPDFRPSPPDTLGAPVVSTLGDRGLAVGSTDAEIVLTRRDF